MSAATRRACVMGWPAKQSKGPIMHGYWIERYGIDGEYRIEEVPPEKFPAFLADLAGHGYVGGNVTLPHKVVALQCSEPDERARAIGAANTLWLDDGVLRSTNTDGEGFFRNLDLTTPGWNADLGSVVVVGAGGASRAIVYGLRERGAEQINLVNRTASRAEALRDAFGPRVQPRTFDELARLIPDARLIVNTSSLGMRGNPDLAWDLSRARPDTVVSDIVYLPLETSLLAEARRHGLRTTDGVGMLLHQAGRGFSLWFGVEPEVTEEQRARVLAALAP
jgi:shikimate dehydrogenase